MTALGKGTPSFTYPPVTGTVRHFRSPADLIESIDTDLESTIALVSSGGTTFLSPILGRLGGIVCLDGPLRSHLAIVSREFEVPCLVGTELTADLPECRGVVPDIEAGAGLVKTPGGDAEAGPPPADVSRQWWDYIRRVGDEIAVKDFDLT